MSQPLINNSWIIVHRLGEVGKQKICDMETSRSAIRGLRKTREYLLKMGHFQSLSARQYFESIETEPETGIDLNSTILPVYQYTSIYWWHLFILLL